MGSFLYSSVFLALKKLLLHEFNLLLGVKWSSSKPKNASIILTAHYATLSHHVPPTSSPCLAPTNHTFSLKYFAAVVKIVVKDPERNRSYTFIAYKM